MRSVEDLLERGVALGLAGEPGADALKISSIDFQVTEEGLPNYPTRIKKLGDVLSI